jgi:hypothetical protein
MTVTAAQSAALDGVGGGGEDTGPRQPAVANRAGREGGDSDPVSDALPDVILPVPDERLISCLDAMARKGRLAGFAALAPGAGARFSAAAIGSPFEGDVRGTCVPGAPEGQTRVRFAARVRPTMFWIGAIILVLTVWPGVVLTESLVASNFPNSSAWEYTWYWYIPMTAPFVPWALWSAWKRSTASVRESSRKVIAQLAKELGGRVIEPGTDG